MRESATDMVMQMERYISADAFEELMAQPEYAHRKLELIEGTIVEMSKTSLGHGQIMMRLGRIIGNFIDERGLGYLTGADAGFVLERNPDGRDTMRALDIAFIARHKSPSQLPFSLGAEAPDLAIEILSPSNTAADIHLKVRQLLAAGTDLVWIVYPESRTVVAHTVDGALTHEQDDMLSGGDVLPGFEIRVGDIFPS